MDVNLEKIDEWLYDLLKDNATLQGYTGYTASDPRIYWFWPDLDMAETIGTSGAYITYYRQTIDSLAGNDVIWALQKGDCIYSIDIFSRSDTTLDNCFNKIDDLLDEKMNVTDITGWKVFRIHRLAGGGLLGRDEDKIFHAHYKYRFSGILKVA